MRERNIEDLQRTITEQNGSIQTQLSNQKELESSYSNAVQNVDQLSKVIQAQSNEIETEKAANQALEAKNQILFEEINGFQQENCSLKS